MCTPPAPTIDNPTTWILSHDTSSCVNTANILISAGCSSSGWTLELHRVLPDLSSSVVYSTALPDGPYEAVPYQYIDDEVPCGPGTISYQWHITCAGVIESSSDIENTTQGVDPSFTNGSSWTLTHDVGDCENTGQICAMVPCGVCAGWTIKIYADTQTPPREEPGHLIDTLVLPAGPDSSECINIVHTPPCGRTTWYYRGVLYDIGGVRKAETQIRSADNGGAGDIISTSHVVDALTCVAVSSVRIRNLNCGECQGVIKLYRNVGVIPTFDPGEVVYQAGTPLSPYGNTDYQFSEVLPDGTYFYAWRLEANGGEIDSTSVPVSVNPECNPYVPAPVTMPEGEFEKQIVLVQVTGTPATGWTYTDKKILNSAEQRLEWWYHKNGGCGAFRLLTHEFLDDFFDSALAQAWEIHVRLKLGGENTYTTWYRGVIRSIRQQEQGAEQYTEIDGYGYVEMLNKIQVQRVYPAGWTVKDVVDHIIANYIKPYTRVVRPVDLDSDDDDGVDSSPYVIQSDLHFECSALKAIKFLAELQGTREFGVDADRKFYFRESVNTIRKAFFVGHDLIDRIAGGKTFGAENQIKVAGKSFGSRDLLKIRADVTDVTANGLYEIPHEVPWVTGDADASRWADSIIAKHKTTQDWSIFQWQNINLRVDASHPIGKIRVYGNDVSNDTASYDVAKIQYIEGGFKVPAEVTEIGVAKQQSTLDQPPLRAMLFVGQYPRDLVEELEMLLMEQVEALKGRHKQYRYPNDVTVNSLPGRIPGEIKHFSKDVTNHDITNNPAELQDITNPRGALMVWLDGQWQKLSVRRTVHALPSRGKYIGEIIALITDLTNQAYGELRWWDGDSWEEFGSGSGGGSGPALSNNNPQQISANYPFPGSPGVSTEAARADHVHYVAAAGTLDVSNTNLPGVSAALIRSDHQHRGMRSVHIKGQPQNDGYVDVTTRGNLTAYQEGQTIIFETTGAAAEVQADVTNARVVREASLVKSEIVKTDSDFTSTSTTGEVIDGTEITITLSEEQEILLFVAGTLAHHTADLESDASLGIEVDGTYYFGGNLNTHGLGESVDAPGHMVKVLRLGAGVHTIHAALKRLTTANTTARLECSATAPLTLSVAYIETEYIEVVTGVDISGGGGAVLSDEDPQPLDVTADPGVGSFASRFDHVHPRHPAGHGLEYLDYTLNLKLDGSTLSKSAAGLKVADLGITDAQVATANKDGIAATPSMRTLGTGAQQAGAGNTSPAAILTTKADILAFTTLPARLPGPSVNGMSLIGDSAESAGLKWVWNAGLGLLLKGSGYDGTLTLVADTSLLAANVFKNYTTVDVGAFTLTIGGSGDDSAFGLIYATTITLDGGIISRVQSSSTFCHVGGAGGGGAGGGGAGGAGSYGGMALWIYCKEITGTGTIRVNGGVGTGGANATVATATANGALGTAPGHTMAIFGEEVANAGSNSGGTGGQSSGTGGTGTSTSLNPNDGHMAALLDILAYLSPGGWNSPTDTVGAGPVARWFRFAGGGGGHAGGRNTGAQGAGGGGAYAQMPGPWAAGSTGPAGGAGAAGGPGAGGGGGGNGGHGGILVVFAMTIAAGITLEARGGAGGGGGKGFDRGGGGAGAHGAHGGTIVHCTAYGTSCTTSVAGGTGGAGGGPGDLGGTSGGTGDDGTAGKVFVHTFAGV